MLKISAILAVHNDTATLARILEHLAANTIDVHVIDHGSNQKTVDILNQYSGHPIIQIIRKPFDGIFRLEEQMLWKNEIIQTLRADWVIHIDADEIFESPRVGETLRGMIERTDAEGFDVINCDEFMFVPANESEDFHGTDFVATMRNYYLFSPPENPGHQRVVRLSTGVPEWYNTGGHRVDLAHRKLAPENLRKKHYVGLSLDALRGQYLARVFSVRELLRGGHYNRIATTPDFIIAPDNNRLFNLDRDGWRVDRPEPKQLIFHQPHPYRPPNRVMDNSNLTPMPFIIGSGRSGTTLLRFLMDAHPALCISPETQWLLGTMEMMVRTPADIQQIRFQMTRNAWKDFGISDAELDTILNAYNPERPFATLRTIYRHYANRFGKSRIGDKTPLHGLSMTKIARVFPEAHFIHLIRDGRDVAVSYRDLWFGPGNDAKRAAQFWVWTVREMRQQAQFVPHYKEVRYEDLVTNPEPVLRAIGDFIQLPFDPIQLDAHKNAGKRLAEMDDVLRNDGLFVPAEQRRSIFTETLSPPNRSRVGRWRTEMTAREIADFESIAGNMLCDLGYHS